MCISHLILCFDLMYTRFVQEIQAIDYWTRMDDLHMLMSWRIISNLYNTQKVALDAQFRHVCVFACVWYNCMCMLALEYIRGAQAYFYGGKLVARKLAIHGSIVYASASPLVFLFV